MGYSRFWKSLQKGFLDPAGLYMGDGFFNTGLGVNDLFDQPDQPNNEIPSLAELRGLSPDDGASLADFIASAETFADVQDDITNPLSLPLTTGSLPDF